MRISNHILARLSCLLAPLFIALSPAFAATHVTGVYAVGSNPSVMATVNGNSEYGLVFAQRNKSITYNNVLYVNNVVTAYFDASGNLNDGAGNQWIDLIPDANATPGDSYYVVTINIQGAVHSEIWIVPDQASVSVLSVRQTEAPPSGGASAPVLFYQTIQQSGADLTQRPTLNLTGTGVSCLDNSGSQRTDCTITSGGGGGSGTVTSFGAGGLSPLFTTSVATPTTTPALSFSLSNAGPHAFLGNNTGGSGAPGFVQPGASDISGLAASATTDTTNAGNISSGTLPAARLPSPTAGALGGVKSFNAIPSVWLTGISLAGTPTSAQPACGDLSDSSGGCTMSTTAGGDLSGTLPSPTVAKVNGTSVPTNAAADQTIVTTASATGAWKAINNCGDSTHALSYATATHAFGCQAITASATAGGSSGQVQWNNSTALAGITNLTTTGTVTTALAGADWLFADPTDATKKAQLDLSGITTSTTRTVTVPNANSTLVVPDTGASNNFLTAISASGAISKAQPAFSNLSGSATNGQLPAAFDISGNTSTEPVKAGTTAGAPGTCVANKELYIETDATAGQQLFICNGTSNGWNLLGDGGGAGGGITTLNTLSAGTQTFATGTSGTDFNISSATSTHTFNIPDAGATARGLVTTGAQTLGGSKTFNSDMQIDATGSTTSSPRTLGVTNLGSGTAARVQFGDSSNAYQLKYAGQMQIYSYWGLELLGSRQTAGSPGFITGGASDAGVTVNNTTAGVVALAVQGASSQSADLQDWQDNSPTVLARVDSSGNITAPTINGTTDLKIGGTSISSAAQTLTNKTIDAEGTGNVITQPSKVWFVAAGCNNATASPGFDLPTSNAPTPTCQGTNIRTASLDYADSAVQKAYFNFKLPSDWTGNIDAKIKWFTTATTNATKWQIATGCLTDGTTDATAGPTLNTAQTVTTNDNATTKSPAESVITTLTTTGCAAGRLMYLELSRDNTDTNTATASVLGVEMTIRRAM